MLDRAPTKGTLMQGKRGLIMGVANDRSLGWGIAAACAAQGAELAFTAQVEALERRVRPLAASVGSDLVYLCDVSDEASVDATFDRLKQQWGQLDFLVHAIAYADKQFLRATSTRRAPPSCRRWTSPATPLSRSASGPCR